MCFRKIILSTCAAGAALFMVGEGNSANTATINIRCMAPSTDNLLWLDAQNIERNITLNATSDVTTTTATHRGRISFTSRVNGGCRVAINTKSNELSGYPGNEGLFLYYSLSEGVGLDFVPYSISAILDEGGPNFKDAYQSSGPAHWTTQGTKDLTFYAGGDVHFCFGGVDPTKFKYGDVEYVDEIKITFSPKTN